MKNKKYWVPYIGLKVLLIFLVLNTLYTIPNVYAQSKEEMQVLRMYFKKDELVITPTRTLKPLSQVAENISIVTAEDIEKINAHTLTDVLYTVTGVQVDLRGGPGSETGALIQGSEFRHVLVKIDGVTLNNLSDNVTDISSIPIQNIERIEIIKGPASSSWGSSLGGIINIITKSPDYSRGMGGLFSASVGERGTGDARFEARGHQHNFGYYFYAGNLSTDGFSPNNDFDGSNAYGKLTWDINKKSDVTFSFGYNKGSRGRGEDRDFDILLDSDFEYLYSTLLLNYFINDNADINFTFRTSRKSTDFFFKQLSTGDMLDRNAFDDKEIGGSLTFLWNSDRHNVVIGTDYDNGELDTDAVEGGFQRLEEWAVYANDTISMNKLSIIPGIRYDHTNTNGDFVSPSFGLTYKLDRKTVLRGYIARGFSIPPLSSTFGQGLFSVPNPDLDVEKVWSYQAGLESTALKYLWLKATLFRHNISDAITNEELPDGRFRAVNEEELRRQGVEVEVKTVPFHDISLRGGFIFVDAENRDTGETLTEVPRYTYDVGVQYNDNVSLHALLTGRYTWWNAQSDFNGNYSDFIWDLNIIKKMYVRERNTIEGFLTVHNIFNGSQYLIGLFKNPERWVEGGVRVRF